jgi:hypothetical protein
MVHADQKRLATVKPIAKSVDVPFKDVHIVTSSGTVFPANRAVLSCHSPVLRGMFEACQPDGYPGRQTERSCSADLKIQSEDTDEQVEALIRYSHDPRELAQLLDGEPDWAELIPLLEMLFKYDVQGTMISSSRLFRGPVMLLMGTTG